MSQSRAARFELDDLLEVRRDQSIDVFLLTESWHDSNSVCLQRLRAEGFAVVERARPRACESTLNTNHGGVVMAAAPGVRLTAVDLNPQPTTFEAVCARVSVASTHYVRGTQTFGMPVHFQFAAKHRGPQAKSTV